MKNKRIYFIFITLTVVLLDQFTKYLVYKYIPINTIKYSFFEDFFRIIHVRNLGIGFSFGTNLGYIPRLLAFSVMPSIIIVLILIYATKSDENTDFQSMMLFTIAGGGMGNIIDRLTRPLGVIDFVDVRFYGLFGLERWPTFNVADSAVVVAMILLTMSWIFPSKSPSKPTNQTQTSVENTQENT